MSSLTAESPVRRDVVNVKDVAEMVDVSQGTVLNWIRSGDLPRPIRIGRTIRWKRSVIQAFIDGKAGA